MRTAALRQQHRTGCFPADRHGAVAEVHRPARGLLPRTLPLFREGERERFAPTWHWPAFGVGWLWYLYRKMYLHAGVFLFGGLLPMVLGAGLVGVVIWNVFAAVAANYLYFMHIKLSLALIERQVGLDETARHRLITDAGGIQPYVWWLGIGLTAVAIAAGIMEAPTPVRPPSSGAPA